MFVNPPNGSVISSLWHCGELVVQHMLPYVTQHDSILSTLFFSNEKGSAFQLRWKKEN
jgi:hypothetical protein